MINNFTRVADGIFLKVSEWKGWITSGPINPNLVM